MSLEERYTLLLDEQAVVSMERLRIAYRLETKADVYSLAIRVLTWATDQRANGYIVARSNEDGTQPLRLPDFDIDKWTSSGG